ncbi:MAG: hypothetical protein HQ472_02415 [Ignavibacteria bacterium]|nr:hypothetical protein [Ignavibacteria bacterium]
MRTRVQIGMLLLFICLGLTQATPREVLTVSVSHTVVHEEISVEIYNAYTVPGGIKSARIASIQGIIIEDFTRDIQNANRGIQVVTKPLTNQPRGIYFVVIETLYETITVKAVKM